MNDKNQSQENSSTDLKGIAGNVAENAGVGPLNEAIVEEKYDNNPLQARIMKMRTNTDSIFRTVKIWGKTFGPGEAGRYANLATTSLESARHFYGKILQEKGASYPYAKDQSSTRIAGQGELFDNLPTDNDEAARFLRDKIEGEVVEMKIYVDQVAHLTAMDFVAQNTVLQKLVEAKCWIGEILGVIAREKEAAK